MLLFILLVYVAAPAVSVFWLLLIMLLKLMGLLMCGSLNCCHCYVVPATFVVAAAAAIVDVAADIAAIVEWAKADGRDDVFCGIGGCCLLLFVVNIIVVIDVVDGIDVVDVALNVAVICLLLLMLLTVMGLLLLCHCHVILILLFLVLSCLCPQVHCSTPDSVSPGCQGGGKHIPPGRGCVVWCAVSSLSGGIALIMILLLLLQFCL